MFCGLIKEFIHHCTWKLEWSSMFVEVLLSFWTLVIVHYNFIHKPLYSWLDYVVSLDINFGPFFFSPLCKFSIIVEWCIFIYNISAISPHVCQIFNILGEVNFHKIFLKYVIPTHFYIFENIIIIFQKH
jgi:hypothetical protein